MADDEITVQEFDESTGETVSAPANVDTKSLTGAGAKTVHRQVACIGSPATFGRVAEVNASNQLTVSVDNNPVLGAGTNAIGKLAANSGVDIGDVDVASIAAGDNAIGRVKLTDGTDVATVRDLTNSDPLDVSIVDGNGDQITSFGGGTQYTEGDTDASVTGTALMWEDAADTLRVASSAKPLPVNVVSGSAAGTEYTEDAASAANPAGGQLMARRRDALAGETSTDGDVVALNATDKGELYVKHVDAIPVTDNAGSLTVDNAALSVTGGGVEASALRVTLASDSTGVVSVDDNAGSLTIDAASLPLPTGASTEAKQDTQITALQLIDDIVKTDDAGFTPATDKVAMVGAEYDDTTPDSVNEGDAGALRMSARRELYTQLRDAAGNERGANVNASNELLVKHTDAIPVTDNAGSLTVDGTVTANAGTDLNTSALALETTASAIKTAVEILDNVVSGTEAQVDVVAALPAGTNNIGDVDIASIAAGTNNIGDVDIASIAAGDNNIGNVDIVTMPNVTLAAGTNTNEVVGDIAHDTGVGGNPLQIAVEAKDMDDTAPPNQVSAESDVARLAGDRDGVMFVHPHGPRVWSYHSDGSTALTDATVHAAPAAGLSLYVTDIVFSSGAATAINLFFEEGASKVLGPYYLEAVAGRGMSLHFQTPKKITAATALTLTTSASIAHCVDVTGFIAQG